MYEMLLKDHPLYNEKIAFSTSKLLPVGTALGGSVLGGAGGALSTKDPANRKKRALMGAAVGGLTGGLGGEVLRRGKVVSGLRGDVSNLENANQKMRESVYDLASRVVNKDDELAHAAFKQRVAREAFDAEREKLKRALDEKDRVLRSYSEGR